MPLTGCAPGSSEHENHLLKEGALTARGGLTARRGELEHEDLKATIWPPTRTAPGAQVARQASALRSSGSGTDNDETHGAEVAEIVQAIEQEKQAGKAGGNRADAGRDDTDTESELLVSEAAISKASAPSLPLGGKGIVGAAREAFEKAAAQGGDGGGADRKSL